MPTTVTSSIGATGRDFSLPHSWADAAAADLTVTDEVERGECYDDADFTISTGVDMDSTADDTRYMILTTATGQSFKDHANKLTNALRANGSNGVLFNMNNDIYVHAAGRNAQIENIQFNQTGGSSPITSSTSGNGTTFGTHRNCIFQSSRSGSGTDGIVNAVRKNYVNCAFISKNTGLWGIQTGGSVGGKISSCTLLNSAGGGRGIDGTDCIVDNTAVFNFSHSDNVVKAGSNNNATDRANFATNSSSDQESLTTTDQIESATSGSEDLRAKSTGALVGNGVRDQTYTNDLDIVGQGRVTAATGQTIGCWEVVAGGAAAEGGGMLLGSRRNRLTIP